MTEGVSVSTIPATYIDGKIVPDVPPDWPNGTRLSIETTQLSPVRMMTEDEQGDDPESIIRWLAATDAIPVARSSPFDDPAAIAWREQMRKFNFDEVRKQMQESPE
jgi:hypothetical protein